MLTAGIEKWCRTMAGFVTGPWRARPELIDFPLPYTATGDAGTYCSLWIGCPLSPGSRATAKVIFTLDPQGHVAGASVLFSARRQTDEVAETQSSIAFGAESIPVLSGWVEAGGVRIGPEGASRSESEEGLLVRCNGIETALQFVDRLRNGYRPTIGVKLKGQRRERVLCLTRPLDAETAEVFAELFRTALAG